MTTFSCQREVCPCDGQFVQKKSIHGNFSPSTFLGRSSLCFLPSAGCLLLFSSALNFCAGFGEEPQENVEYVTVFKTSA